VSGTAYPAYPGIEVRYLLLFALCTPVIAADFEAGANVGYGFYRNGTIYGAGATADAGMRNRFTAGVDLTYDFAQYVAAQFSYLYHDGHPFLGSSGSEDRYAREFAGSHARVAVPLQAS
jgi:hypothetical protein